MLGAIAGDIIGSVYEHRPIKTTDFPLFQEGSRFTDDSVLTLAIAEAILEGKPYGECLQEFGRAYPRAGYGENFYQWIFAEEIRPYHSWGNGAAMRVSPVGFAFEDEMTVLLEAQQTAAVSHNHPEGIKGAQATAMAVFLARRGQEKAGIRKEISQRFGYDLNRQVDEIRPDYQFDVSCQGTVPEALVAFLDSENYQDAVRKAVSRGGDSDTLACITGGIAQAYYGEIPQHIIRETRARLPQRLLEVLDRFLEEFAISL